MRAVTLYDREHDSDAAGGTGREPLREAALGPHDVFLRMLDAAATPAPGAGPRRTQELTDALMASTCMHLAAAEETLLPLARRRRLGGRAMVAAYLRQARQLEHALDALKALLYGEAHARHTTEPVPWPRLRRLLSEHHELEATLLDALGPALTEDEARAVAQRLVQVAERAPTRPHPYSPHTGLAGRVSHRVWSVVDGLWDTAEGRSVPHPAPAPHAEHNGLVTAYVLGAPHFDESDVGGG